MDFQIENVVDVEENQTKTSNYATHRSVLRSSSHLHERLQISLQTCKVRNNLTKLYALQENTTSKSLRARLYSLICILETMQIPSNFMRQDADPNNETKIAGYMDFKDALSLYIDTLDFSASVREDDIASRLLDDLLHPEHGISCVLYRHTSGRRYIILQNDDNDISELFLSLLRSEEESLMTVSDRYSKFHWEFVTKAISSMDTEYDKNVVRSLMSTLLTRDEMCRVGIKPETAAKHLGKLEGIFREIDEVHETAEEMVAEKLTRKIATAEKNLEVLNRAISGNLSERRRDQVNAKVQMLNGQTEKHRDIVERKSKRSQQCFKKAVKRLSNNLITERRIKSRRLGAGAPSLLDSEDEEFIAHAIEEKSSAHGRRHDTVLYLNHRVKSDDLLSLANYTLYKRNKKLIKSSRTVQLRARPRRINTREGKRHTGKWLFCCKKPPKTEEHETETTHHQRAHVKLNRVDMFDGSNTHTGLEISMDDKAYLRPGTDVGFRDTKAGCILQLTDEKKQRKLPQHDFGSPEVYQTPSSFRLLTWKTEQVGGADKLIKDLDQSLVVIRPKHYIGSSGSVWASDMMSLRYEQPDLFEERNNPAEKTKRVTHSVAMRRFCSRVHDSIFYFIDSTTETDVLCVKGNTFGKFHTYETTRLQALQTQLNIALNRWESDKDSLAEHGEKNRIAGLVVKLQEIQEQLNGIMQSIEGFLTEDVLSEKYQASLSACRSVLQEISSWELPEVCSVISESTDAGPGVGVTNIEVKFRFTEMSRIQGTERRVRIHRARGDSAQNEVERTNAAIGDALVDGATMQWEHEKPFEMLAPDFVAKMTVEEVEQHKNEVMEDNAWLVSEAVCLRINDEKGPGGDYMAAYVTEREGDRFFYNRSYLMEYWEASKSKKMLIPGHGYFSKVYNFMDVHCEYGELYMEYRKRECLLDSEEACEFCATSADNKGVIAPVPRPYPDYSRLPKFHYCCYKDTPRYCDGERRQPDDFQPRAQLKKLVSSGQVLNTETLENFSRKFIVSVPLVQEYVQHLGNISMMKEKRKCDRQKKSDEEKSKPYDGYDWVEMFHSKLLEKQPIYVLEKYIKYNKLGPFKLKRQMLECVRQHLAKTIYIPQTGQHEKPTRQEQAIEEEDDAEDFSDVNGGGNDAETDSEDEDVADVTDSEEDRDDVIIRRFDSSDESSDSEEEILLPTSIGLSGTRTRRVITKPSRYFDFY